MSKALLDLPLTIDPEHELRFVGPFNRPVVTIMSLRNNSALPLVFKIKTTAPKRYCVRPNIGKIMPFRSTQVEICLQPFIYDQQEKNKHKFMVQSVLAPTDADLTDLNKLWKELEPEQLMDAKLKCVFEMPSAEANAENTSGRNTVGGATGIAEGGSAAANTSSASAEPLESKPKLENFGLLSSEDKPSNLADTWENIDFLTGEIKALRETNIELRKENLHLKDQITRYRSSQAIKQVNEPYAPVLAEKQIPVFYIAIAIAAAIISLLLGKFFL
ncbi:vesicle-associated membrane protein-associated protein B/C [Drosophila erecta]|uniref:MSP domain-containing protein n=1 Tax=Drosophila erecta TaxID=7220 RepID=B3NST1_DROER|nr:vesicle-associated membrane protein-associated protein B/C [Drosophila erecta]XP_026838017.1 vesicle-associated membrane protein-associated protein B/C [Drosophila erecta]XP_026838018.1 vesicle-associated membrane protein-associated protein B/C [Drosophila erecta]XP_026838019.1 vesicle-associated membrane protein-associated protein B/C [Drosophila erecta]XP_026838020.1 vesicle-associated membrane protein-associated protein B/C [Drosophila erecta]XP_026838021.1 vesicle-associated membrane pr